MIKWKIDIAFKLWFNRILKNKTKQGNETGLDESDGTPPKKRFWS